MRKAIKFYISYYEVACELNDKDRLAFYDALLKKQFYNTEPKLTGMAKFAYISQKHSIDAQIKGYYDVTKDEKFNPTIPPTEGGTIAPTIPPTEEVKEEVKEESISNNNNNKKRDFLEKKFEEIFFKWIEYKKERKESYKSIKSEEVFYNKLLELSNYSPFEAEQIINQSIANNWAGIFPIKNNNLTFKNNATTTTTNPNDRRSGVERLNKLTSEFLQDNPGLFTLRDSES